ncbi:MAG: hypothetical protein ABT02_07125 [Comamonadaceae bacterium SCN 68-20]|nr:MAG: hypothetical protein ABT02_07125 [Comamonadaceae bacterium SCN 68-20]OJX05680.1 MAG: hypothetical protein BGO75_16025 [Burkholderiales bacterium 68-20]
MGRNAEQIHRIYQHQGLRGVRVGQQGEHIAAVRSVGQRCGQMAVRRFDGWEQSLQPLSWYMIRPSEFIQNLPQYFGHLPLRAGRF